MRNFSSVVVAFNVPTLITDMLLPPVGGTKIPSSRYLGLRPVVRVTRCTLPLKKDPPTRLQ